MKRGVDVKGFNTAFAGDVPLGAGTVSYTHLVWDAVQPEPSTALFAVSGCVVEDDCCHAVFGQ